MQVFVRNITSGIVNVQGSFLNPGDRIGPVTLDTNVMDLAQQNLVAVASSLAADGVLATISADADDVLVAGVDPIDTLYSGTLTANRTVTLSTFQAYNGARFRITRTGGGAFTLSVGGLKNLAQNTWAHVMYNGAAWVLVAYGAL